MTDFVSVGEAAAGVVGKLKRPLIDRPGVYRLTLEQYHGQPCSGPSISSSGLRRILRESPAHFYAHSSLNPDRIEDEETQALLLGRAAHHLLLGEDDFSTLFIARPERFDSWRTNEAKTWKAKQEADGRTVLLPAQLEQIRGMARALARHPLVQAGILNGEIEQSMIFRDKTGVYLKNRPDSVPNDSGDFCDLKTTRKFGEDLDREIFGGYRYDMAAALTKWAAKEVLGLNMASFSFVFVESEPPHCVEVVTLKLEDIEEAEADLRVAIDTFAYCLKTENWFGPSGTQSDARYAHKPEWVQKSQEFRRAFLEREIAA